MKRSAPPAEADPPPSTDAGADQSAGDPESKKPPYPLPAAQPTQPGPDGIRFDFNHGARVILPSRTEGKWRVRLRDLNTGNILFLSGRPAGGVCGRHRD